MPPRGRSHSSHRSSHSSHHSSSSHRSSSFRSSSSSRGFSSSHGSSSYHRSSSNHSSYSHHYGSSSGEPLVDLLINGIEALDSAGYLSDGASEEDWELLAGVHTEPDYENTAEARAEDDAYCEKKSKETEASIYPQFTRKRYHQPSGYTSHTPGFVRPVPYHCKNHDYLYFGFSWTDEITGISYKKGYYDEAGNYYPGLVLKNGNVSDTVFHCEYCNTEVKAAWTEGKKPTCPNCNAQMTESITEVDEVIRNEFDQYYNSEKMQKAFARKRILEKVQDLVVIAIILLVLAAGVWGYKTISSDKNRENPLYVEEIGRQCYWSDEYDSYYDPVSDCYFWYNDEIDHPDWQYWYEGISSDYGDYGWMEYDYQKKQWYIEVNEGQWEPLPNKYKSKSYIWHK